MYLGESRRSFVNTFLNFGKDKEHKLGTDWRAFHKMGDLFENDKIPERDEGLNGCRDMLFPRVERWWDVHFNFLHNGAGAWFM